MIRDVCVVDYEIRIITVFRKPQRNVSPAFLPVRFMPKIICKTG